MQQKIKWITRLILIFLTIILVLLGNIKITLAYDSWEDIPDNEMSDITNPNAVDAADALNMADVWGMDRATLEKFVDKYYLFASGAYWALSEEDREEYYYDLFENVINDMLERVEELKDEISKKEDEEK